MTAQLELLGVRGMAEAASHAHPADLASLRLTVEALAKTGTPFTAEECRARLSAAQNERLDAFPNAIGGTFYQLQREGVILGVGYAASTRKEARGRPLRLWRGTQP